MSPGITVSVVDAAVEVVVDGRVTVVLLKKATTKAPRRRAATIPR